MDWIGNAFSLNMLADLGPPPHSAAYIEATALSMGEVRLWIRENEPRSCIGHEPTAAIVSDLLGEPIAMVRETVKLCSGDRILVAQYSGPRLPEGATVLPVDASIQWVLVRIV
jgi:hypothetical protein